MLKPEANQILQSFMDSRPLGFSRVAIVRKVHAALWGDGHMNDVRDALIWATDHDDVVLKTAVEKMVADYRAHKAGSYRKSLQEISRVIQLASIALPLAAASGTLIAMLAGAVPATISSLLPLSWLIIGVFVTMLIVGSHLRLALDPSLNPIHLSDGEVFDPRTEVAGFLKILMN